MNSEKYLNFSQFAKITGTTRQTLIFYDRIGLFTPEKKSENGYRQYSYNQIGLITAIETLSELKVPLKEIKSIVSDLTPDRAEKLFKHQLGMITREIVRLRRLRDMTKTRLEQIKIGSEVLEGKRDFCIEEISEPVPLFLGESLDIDKANIPDEAMMRFFNGCEKKGIPFGYTSGFEVSQNNLLCRKYNIAHKVLVLLNDEKLANGHMPVGKYAVGYAFGDYGFTDYIYDDLMNFIDENGFCVDGDSYENYIHDEVITSEPQNYVLKIMVKVKRQ